jgi:hypothetical protein
MAEFIGVSGRWIRSLTNKLVESGLMEKRGVEKHGLRCTKKWYDTAYKAEEATVGTKFRHGRNKVPGTGGTNFQSSEQSSYSNPNPQNKVPTSYSNSNKTSNYITIKGRYFDKIESKAPHLQDEYRPTKEYFTLLEKITALSREQLGMADINIDRYLFSFGGWSAPWRSILSEKAYSNDILALYKKFLNDSGKYKITDFIKAMQDGLPEAFRGGLIYGKKESSKSQDLTEQFFNRFPELESEYS